jgi:DNA polymerase-3 subunit delta
MTFEQIIGDIKKKIYHPVYFFHGEESFYIDQLSDYMEKNILSESEKEFNQTIVYGKDLDNVTLISYARRYPMMSSFQLVIVKEAQDMKSLLQKEKEETSGETKDKKIKKDSKDDKDPFIEYLLKPTPSTILVFCYKHKKLDKRMKASKLIDKNAIVFESKKVADYQISAWITNHCKEEKIKINTKAIDLLAEYLGNDLSKIKNEIDKLLLNLKDGQEISTTMVQENIGISKDFNIFELIKAIGYRNTFKSFQIAEYFAANPKNNPMILTISQLYTYFLKIVAYHKLDDRSTNNAASELGVNPYFLNDYVKAAKEYPLSHCMRNISYIREYDLRSKGVNNVSTNDGDLLKELIYKIMN